MRYTFLNKQPDNRRLILIFGGWACDESAYANVGVKGWDVLLCSEYDDLTFDKNQIAGYRTIYLYAWSLGVFVADRCLKDVRLARAMAINGTLWPIDDQKGIAEAVFLGTAERLDADNLLRFARRMFGCNSDFKERKSMFESRNDIDRLQAQLYLIANESKQSQPSHIRWTDAYIGGRDMIFTTPNQRNAWREYSDINIIEEDVPHFVDFERIINSTVINTERVGRLFQRSIDSYDSNAQAQRHIINLLAEAWQRYSAGRNCQSILEIGYGSGMFSKVYAPMFAPESIDYIDLCLPPSVPFALASRERYLCEEAEAWMSNLPDTQRYDAIVSTSTIQWFSDPEQFVEDCAGHLEHGGVLAFSSFGGDNLCQLNTSKLRAMQYLSAARWREVLSDNYTGIQIIEDSYDLWFDSVKELLAHLKGTGVTGGTKSSISRVRALTETLQPDERGRYKLTYSPIIILATRK